MDELKDMIALLKRPDFDPGEIDTDAIQDGYIKRFDMRVNSRDGDQDLSKHRFHQMNPQVIPSYPLLFTYITGYPRISLSDNAAPGLLPDSPALSVQPGGSL